VHLFRAKKVWYMGGLFWDILSFIQKPWRSYTIWRYLKAVTSFLSKRKLHCIFDFTHKRQSNYQILWKPYAFIKELCSDLIFKTPKSVHLVTLSIYCIARRQAGQGGNNPGTILHPSLLHSQ
jgi:hypothetical protein